MKRRRMSPAAWIERYPALSKRGLCDSERELYQLQIDGLRHQLDIKDDSILRLHQLVVDLENATIENFDIKLRISQGERSLIKSDLVHNDFFEVKYFEQCDLIDDLNQKIAALEESNQRKANIVSWFFQRHN